MKTVKYIGLLLLVLFSSFLKAENNIMFDKANQLYHNHNYDSASQLYLQMIQDGYCHPDLYYNAGNAFYRNNKIGMAIWSFKKALAMHNEKNYEDNLLLSQKRIKNNIIGSEQIFFVQWWQSAYSLFTVNKWALLALSFFLLSLAFLFVKNVLNKQQISRTLIQTSIVLCGFSLFFLGVRYYNDTYHYKGIIIQADTPISIKSNSKITNLSEGLEVEFVARKNNNILVKLPNGMVGSIPEIAFKKL